MTSDEPLLRTVDLKKYFAIRRELNPFNRSPRRYVRAVDGVSITVPRGQTVGIVGESGCGKTTLAEAITLLSPPTGGEIHLGGRRIDNSDLSRREIYRDMQMVFQDPDSSLDPQMKVGDSIGEPLSGLIGYSDSEVKQAVKESLGAVGLSTDFADRLPRQLSGGQRQRAAIARAISPHPKLVILDEPTSALDASVQAQILRLLIDLQKKFGLSYILITHNIAVAKYMSDSIAVMYSGKVVESGSALTVIGAPRHPYTRALIQSAPIPDPRERNLLKIEIKGEVPSAINPPSGCRFNPRCPYAEDLCAREIPPLRDELPSHWIACHFTEKTATP